MEEATWNSIIDLAEVISKKLKKEGNPHQEVVITQTKVKLVSDEKGVPFNHNTGPIHR